ncbi:MULTISPECIES: NAD(P)/FAD-dependent oxidoreductase [unclassified Cyanobium]|uniref:NAD(P)/FAD-dependent oxidoreductase n=1 Tax=unclassified Cyanobium TaxID=2627006 RepID=UPI0020CBB725|nr:MULTISPECIES: FAD-dependent oxidoreductase [unclassified Cyanobium]MCP9778259.1 FAD-dependent oxidoreductase [Cyanobium sp. Tous-M-B4]MCP9877794.1 FAD-dependent oxidoreductase [Cyanobium sp. A2C-AMD]
MLRLSELKLPLDHSEADLAAAVLRRLRLAPDQLLGLRLVKRSVDARKSAAITLVYSLDLDLDLDARAEARLLKRFAGDPHLRPSPDTTYHPVVSGANAGKMRPVVVGAGPCGYFAALLLAQMGFRPLLLERGKAVKQRSADTFGFWKGSADFNPESNAQFGEGGAGTFSDGKLYSQVSEAKPYVRKVLEELVAAGANPDILTLHHPHIGTYKLATVVRGLRQRIETLGGEVRFQCRVDGLELNPVDRSIQALQLDSGERIAATQVVLALGHSARDSFEMLKTAGVAMQPKPFAVGLRIEHPQSLIDRARWGPAAGHPRLGPAEYKLVHHCRETANLGRSVYSFCMCPGGLVVGATSEPGRVVTNGMSQHTRNERNANSGIVVGIELADLTPYGESADDPLAGVAFQRHWEGRAFVTGGSNYQAPAQLVGDFLANRPSQDRGGVIPSYQPGVCYGNLAGCLPEFVLTAIREALPAFERRIPGFLMGDALLTGVETRTSSPVRLPRDEITLESGNTPGLYPAGEGAGYAGGILSAAIDGIKVAEQVALSITLPRPQHPVVPSESVCGPT